MPLIDGFEALQCLVERQHVTPHGSRSKLKRFIQRHPRDATASFRGITRPRMVDENLPHQSRGDTEKVRSAVPPNLPSVHEPEKRLMNERGGLDRRGAWV